MRLVAVEIDRFRSRRAIALALLAALLLTALLVVTAAWDTRPASDAEVAAAESQVATASADPRLQREQAQCAERPEDFFGPGGTAADCEGLAPRLEDFLPRNALDPGRVVDNRGLVEVVVVTSLLVLCGITFAGGDWASRSMSTQLLFRPRRTQVWLAKGAAVLLVSGVAATVLLAAFWVPLLLVVQARGLETPAVVQEAILWSSLRGVALAAAGALGGYALTMLLRSTVAALAVLFLWVVGGEALLLALPLDRAGEWSLANNVLAWVKDGTRVFDTDVTCPAGQDSCIQVYTLGMAHGAAYLGALLAVTAVLSWWSFRRRDVG